MVKIDDIKKTLEDIDNVLNKRRGLGGSPLAYITRDVLTLPEHTPGEVDQGFGMPSREAELVRRTRHDGSACRQDNRVVWAIILVRHVAYGGLAWAWVSSFGRHENGNEAYHTLRTHYFGDSFTTRVVTKADATIEKLYWDGRAKNYSLETFFEQLNKAYTDLDENGEPITEAKKVRRLLQSIRDPRLEAAKNSDTHKENFEASMSHLAHTLDMIKTTTVSTRNMSTTQTYGGQGQGRGRGCRSGRGNARGGRFGRGGRGRGRGGRRASAFDPNDPGKSYSPKDWRTLSIEEQAMCRAARAENPGGGGARPRAVATLGTVPEAGAPAPASSGGPGIGRDRNQNG